MAELPDALHAQITELCRSGDELVSEDRFRDAISAYETAWDLLPEPREDWEAATFILAALGDAQIAMGEYALAAETLKRAMHCPDAIGNPYLHLRLGQCQFELNNLDRAGDELSRAFLLEGPLLFRDDDPKYLAYVKSVLREPEGGWDGYFRDHDHQ